MRSATAPEKRLLIEVDRHAIELDRLFNGCRSQGNQTQLKRITEHEQVAGNAVAHQTGRQRSGFDKVRLVGTDGINDRLLHRLGREHGIRVAREFCGWRLLTVDHRMGDLAVELGDCVGPCGNQQVATQQKVRLASGNAHREQVFLTRSNADMADHRAELLRQPGLVQHAATLAFQVGGITEHRPDRGHASPADPGQQYIERPLQRWQQRLRQTSECRDLFGHNRLTQFAAMHGDEARAETLDAAEILVAGTLVDFPLAALSGFLGQHRQTTGFDPAITTAFAHGRVDQRAFFQIRQGAAFAPATLFSRAGLVVDDHRHPFELTQLALHAVQVTPVMKGGN